MTVHSNNDFLIVDTIFLDNEKDAQGCPSAACSDCGSENFVLAAIQSCFCSNHQD